ncbi:MAG: methionyl-tRNA formyltransferase [Clostridia bacterium]|nr:methionyl-tRNA formyltransferase [Clostridia bacterium]
MAVSQSDVKKYALEKNIKVFQPERIRKNPEFLEEIKSLKADIACVVVYGQILPKSFLELFPKGCINVHPSLLPKYRGAAPIQWAIINGDKETGVCTMYLDVGMDDGDVIEREVVEIGEEETAGELWDRLAVLGSKLLVKTVNDIAGGDIHRTVQTGEVVIAPKIEKEMSKINWDEMDAVQIKNLMRGLTPGLGVYSSLNGKKIKFWKAEVLEDKAGDIPFGTVLVANEKQGLQIKTKKGILSILEIQGENAKRMPISDFLRGNKIDVGEKFE